MMLSVTKDGTGSGTVMGSPAGINCGAACYQAVTQGTAISLTATAISGSTFMGWSGACSGTGTCAVTIGSATDVRATFDTDRVDRPLTPNPTPVVTSVLPGSLSAGGAATTLTVNGSGFVVTSVVRWNGTARTTTFVSKTQLQAAITKSDLATAGSVPVTVFNPTPGGGTSGAVSFVIGAATLPPAAPGWPSVTTLNADSTGVTFAVAWTPVSGAVSYRYSAGFSNGTSGQQGVVTTPPLQLRMPYSETGAAASGFVCVVSVNATGQQSTSAACNSLSVPARPSTATSTPAPGAPRPSGLVAAYAFDETSSSTVTDVSGNNNTGTLGAGVGRTTGGRFGGALVFNGDSSVTVPHTVSLNLTMGMTLEAWVFPTAHGSGIWRNVIIKERPGGEVYNLYSNVDTNVPTVYVVRSAAPDQPLDARGTAALPLNAWTHLAATHDGATLRLYVNGVQVGSRAVAGALLTSTGALRIGGNSIWGEFFQGRIDEVRVHNRALSATEIQTIMSLPLAP
jgi:hypothetical protein